MVQGPVTRSQARTQSSEGVPALGSSQEVANDPDNVVSEPPLVGFMPPPTPDDSGSTQMRISMEMLGAQMRWVLDEVHELQRERIRDQDDARRARSTDAPGTRPMMIGEGSTCLTAGHSPQYSAPLLHYPPPPLPNTQHAPPLLPNPPFTTAGGLLSSPTHIPPIYNHGLYNNGPPISFSAPIYSQEPPIPHSTFNWPAYQHPPFPNSAFMPQQNSTHYSLKPRPEFPLYIGKDVQSWIYRVEQLLEYYDVPYEQRVRNAALYLDEGPLQWYDGGSSPEGVLPHGRNSCKDFHTNLDPH